MSAHALAALYVETPVYVTRDDYEHQIWACGLVAWDPVAQEHNVTRVELHLPEGVGRLRAGEEMGALDTLAEVAEKQGVGCCVACANRGGTKRQATGPDWLCDEDRRASPALTLIEARH